MRVSRPGPRPTSIARGDVDPSRLADDGLAHARYCFYNDGIDPGTFPEGVHVYFDRPLAVRSSLWLCPVDAATFDEWLYAVPQSESILPYKGESEWLAADHVFWPGHFLSPDTVVMVIDPTNASRTANGAGISRQPVVFGPYQQVMLP